MATEEATTELARKIRVRAGHRGSATRLVTQARAALEEDPPVKKTLELARSNLKRKMDILAPLDAGVLELTPDEIDQADQYQENILHTIALLDKVLHDMDTPHENQPYNTSEG